MLCVTVNDQNWPASELDLDRTEPNWTELDWTEPPGNHSNNQTCKCERFIATAAAVAAYVLSQNLTWFLILAVTDSDELQWKHYKTWGNKQRRNNGPLGSSPVQSGRFGQVQSAQLAQLAIEEEESRQELPLRRSNLDMDDFDSLFIVVSFRRSPRHSWPFSRHVKVAFNEYIFIKKKRGEEKNWP